MRCNTRRFDAMRYHTKRCDAMRCDAIRYNAFSTIRYVRHGTIGYVGYGTEQARTYGAPYMLEPASPCTGTSLLQGDHTAPMPRKRGGVAQPTGKPGGDASVKIERRCSSCSGAWLRCAGKESEAAEEKRRWRTPRCSCWKLQSRFTTPRSTYREAQRRCTSVKFERRCSTCSGAWLRCAGNERAAAEVRRRWETPRCICWKLQSRFTTPHSAHAPMEARWRCTTYREAQRRCKSVKIERRCSSCSGAWLGCAGNESEAAEEK